MSEAPAPRSHVVNVLRILSATYLKLSSLGPQRGCVCAFKSHRRKIVGITQAASCGTRDESVCRITLHWSRTNDTHRAKAPGAPFLTTPSSTRSSVRLMLPGL